MLFVVTENARISLAEFCREALDWLPIGRERLVLVTGWSGYTPDHLIVFNALRKGAGLVAPLEAAPGQLFTSTKSSFDYEDRPEADVIEEAMAMWLMALMQEWTWDGYALVHGSSDVVTLGGGLMTFESAEPARMAEAETLIARFGLKSRTTFPWAN